MVLDSLINGHFDFSSLLHLQKLSLHQTMRYHFPKVPSTVRHLDLGRSLQLCNDFGESSDNLCNADLKELTSLVLPASNIGTAYLRKLLEPSKGRIEVLDLSSEGYGQRHDLNLEDVMDSQFSTSLKELSVSRNDFGDGLFEHIARNCPRLQFLNASYTRITGVGVKALVLKPGEKLKKVNLRHCERVGIDAVDFARASGVEVDFTFPDEKQAGKKVRSVQ